MKKLFKTLIIAGIVLGAQNASAAEIGVGGQSTVTTNAEISGHKIDMSLEYMLKANKIYKNFGMQISRSFNSADWSEVIYKPSVYVPSSYTASEYTAETSGSPSSYVPSKYTKEVVHYGNNGNDKEKGKVVSVTPSCYTPSSYTVETSGESSSYIPSQYTPESYEPESVSTVKTHKSIEIIQAMATYSHPISDNANVITGLGMNFVDVNGDHGRSLASMVGVEIEKPIVENMKLVGGMAYNYNTSIDKLGMNNYSRMTSQIGVMYTF